MVEGRRTISSSEELIEALELEHLRFNRYTIERNDEPADESLTDDEPSVGVFPELSEDGTSLRVRVKMDYAASAFTIGITFEIVYVVIEPIAPPGTEVLGPFLGRSTMLTAIPFLREAMQSAGARLQLPVPLINLVRSQDMAPATPIDEDSEVEDNS
jgi:hypothetical protein